MKKHSAALMLACLAALGGVPPITIGRRKAEFSVGRLIMSDAVKAVVHAQGYTIDSLIDLHVACDFGKVDRDQRSRNNCNIRFGKGEVKSRYVLPNGVTVDVVTNLEPETTTLTLGRE